MNVVGHIVGSGNFGSLYFSASEESSKNGFWLTLGATASSDTVWFPCNSSSSSISTFDVFFFPNPFSQQLTIDNNEGKIVTYEITLTNSKGQVVSRKIITGFRIIIPDWSSLPRRIYFVSAKVGIINKKQKY